MAAVQLLWQGGAHFSLLQHGAWVRYGAAAALSALALGVRFAVDDILPPGFPYVTFFPAVILATFIAGLGPGIVAAVLCGLSAWFFFIPPWLGFAVNGPTLLAQGLYSAVVAVDIALVYGMQTAMSRLSAERARTKELLDARTTMFHELRHRVANNMQFVSALLALQKRTIGITPESAAAALDEAVLRLETMARVHRRLHDPQASHNFAAHVEALCHDLLHAAGADSIVCVVSVSAAPRSPERLLALALLIVEAVTNCLKHAFVQTGGGTVRIDLHPRPDDPAGLRLCIADDGIGLPAGFDVRRSSSLGWTIIHNLAGQLGGRLIIGPPNGGAPGACIEVVFPA